MNPLIATYMMAGIVCMAFGALLGQAFVVFYRTGKSLIVWEDPRTMDMGYSYVKPKNGVYTHGKGDTALPIPLDGGRHSHNAGRHRGYLVNLARRNSFIGRPDTDDLPEPGPDLFTEATYSKDAREINMAGKSGWKEMIAEFTPLILLIMTGILIATLFLVYKLYKAQHGGGL